MIAVIDALALGRPVVLSDIGIAADGYLLARLAPGRSLTEPALRTVRSLDRLSAPARTELRAHMETWLERQVKRHVGDLARLTAASSDRHYGPPVRALTAMLAQVISEFGPLWLVAVAARPWCSVPTGPP